MGLPGPYGLFGHCNWPIPETCVCHYEMLSDTKLIETIADFIIQNMSMAFAANEILIQFVFQVCTLYKGFL